MKILNWGDNPNQKGLTVRVGEKTLATLATNQALFGFDQIALDYEHNTVPDSPAFKASTEPRSIAAKGVPIVVRGEGVFIDRLNWTPSGQENALNYIDLSAAPAMDESGEVIFIHSAALCRQGAVNGITAFNVSITPKETPTVNYKSMLLKILNLGDDATDKDIEARAGDLIKIGQDHKTLYADVQALKDTVQTLSADTTKRDRAALLARAAREGKVIPLADDQIAGIPVEILSHMVEKLPVTVPIDQRTPEIMQPLSIVPGGGAADEEVRKTLGISKEDWVKHSK